MTSPVIRCKARVARDVRAAGVNEVVCRRAFSLVLVVSLYGYACGGDGTLEAKAGPDSRKDQFDATVPIVDASRDGAAEGTADARAVDLGAGASMASRDAGRSTDADSNRASDAAQPMDGPVDAEMTDSGTPMVDASEAGSDAACEYMSDDDAGACSLISGSYRASYTPIAGNCGPRSSIADVVIDACRAVNLHIEPFGEDLTLMTEVVIKGCAARFSQSIRYGNFPRLSIFSDHMSVQDDSTLTGVGTIYEVNENQMQTCYGQYEILLTHL